MGGAPHHRGQGAGAGHCHRPQLSTISPPPRYKIANLFRAFRARNGRAGPFGGAKQRCPAQKVSPEKLLSRGIVKKRYIMHIIIVQRHCIEERDLCLVPTSRLNSDAPVPQNLLCEVTSQLGLTYGRIKCGLRVSFSRDTPTHVTRGTSSKRMVPH